MAIPVLQNFSQRCQCCERKGLFFGTTTRARVWSVRMCKCVCGWEYGCTCTCVWHFWAATGITILLQEIAIYTSLSVTLNPPQSFHSFEAQKKEILMLMTYSIFGKRIRFYILTDNRLISVVTWSQEWHLFTWLILNKDKDNYLTIKSIE